MNDFLYLVLSELQSGIVLAALAALLCVAVLLVTSLIFKRKNKDGRKFPWKKAILILLFVGYAAVVLYVTVLRSTAYGTRFINLHLFRAWREAWNSFSLKNWLNVLLNVAMFLPLGILLPLMRKGFRKWYCMLPAGFCASLLIEVWQYVTGRGLFDVDDLFANTLGAVLGYCVVMVLITLCSKKEKKWKPTLGYAAFPVITMLALSGIFLAYELQEYGNLEDAAAFPVNTKSVEWQLSCELEDSRQNAAIYRTEGFDKEACDAFGAAFFEKIGAELQDIHYYDKETHFSQHSSPGQFLTVSRLDGTYEYFNSGEWEDNAWAEAEEEKIRDMLLSYDIQIPDNAVFTYDGDGWHQFTVEQYRDGDTMGDGKVMVDGILRCRYTESGTLCRIDNGLITYEYYGKEQIISEREAYEQLCKGKFSSGDGFAYYAPKKIEVKSCTLQYQIDTKSFLQPVYIFEVAEKEGLYEGKIMIPALCRVRKSKTDAEKAAGNEADSNAIAGITADDSITAGKADISNASLIHSEGMTLETRVSAPEGYTRTAETEGSLGQFLRNYRMKEDGAKVLAAG